VRCSGCSGRHRLCSESSAPGAPFAAGGARQQRDEELLAGIRPCANPAGCAAINGSANRLAKAADYGHPVKVHDHSRRPVNAFTLPGGQLLFLFRPHRQGARRQRGGGRAGHEMGHAVHYHSMKALPASTAFNQLLRVMTGDIRAR